MNTRQVGNQYEEIAAAYLIRNHYRIIKRNYRNTFGEIDIIAEDSDHTICYVEVKYRSSRQYGDPLEAVDNRKQKRISRVASVHYFYCAQGRACRFDVIGVYEDQSLTHIKNAFPFQ